MYPTPETVTGPEESGVFVTGSSASSACWNSWLSNGVISVSVIVGGGACEVEATEGGVLSVALSFNGDGGAAVGPGASLLVNSLDGSGLLVSSFF